eukprot:scaffold870_cov393-Prasinococcus_capsulatus_cf.AAC.7
MARFVTPCSSPPRNACARRPPRARPRPGRRGGEKELVCGGRGHFASDLANEPLERQCASSVCCGPPPSRAGSHAGMRSLPHARSRLRAPQRRRLMVGPSAAAAAAAAYSSMAPCALRPADAGERGQSLPARPRTRARTALPPGSSRPDEKASLAAAGVPTGGLDPSSPCEAYKFRAAPRHARIPPTARAAPPKCARFRRGPDM